MNRITNISRRMKNIFEDFRKLRFNRKKYKLDLFEYYQQKCNHLHYQQIQEKIQSLWERIF